MSTSIGGQRCSYINCKKSRRDDRRLQQYRFPKEESRCRMWIVNSGNTSLLSISPESLYKSNVVCSDHFEDKDFINPKLKTRLKKDVIPKPYDVEMPDCKLVCPTILKVLTPLKTYEKSTSIVSPQPSTSMENTLITPKTEIYVEDITDMPSLPYSSGVERKLPFDKDCPQKKKLKATISHQRDLLKNKRSTISRLKKRIKQLVSQENIVYNFSYPSKYSRALTTMQTLHRPNSEWSIEEKDTALVIFNKSPSTYKFLRDQLKIVLPSRTSIRKWTESSNFSTRLLTQVQENAPTITEEETCCTSLFDEIIIKTEI